jgi:hypothetical protein
VALFANFAAFSGAGAEAPAATVPPKLQGDWQTFFGSLGPVTVHLTANSATLSSDRNETLGYMAGAFPGTDQATLKVLWDLPAFQQDPGNALPAIVWPDAMLDKGDPAYPGYIATDVSLRYDPDHDELFGTYTSLNIKYHPDTIKYDTAVTSPVDIRLTRAKTGGGYLRITGSQPGKQLTTIDLGDKFWIELKPPKGDRLEGVSQVQVTVRTDDATYGTPAPITVTLSKADINAAVFRGPAEGIPALPFSNDKSADKFVTIYGDTVRVEHATLRYHASAQVRDYAWDDGAENARFTLGATTPGVVEVAPDKADHIGVALQNSARQPIPGATINWHFHERKVSVSGLTNTRGIAELYFALTPAGDYALWADGASERGAAGLGRDRER